MDDRHDFLADDLATLVGSRLCHDLVNPLSAVSSGLELLEMTGAPELPELALIADAVRDAHARIRFFRIAFGAARPGDRLSQREIAETLEGVHGAGRLDVAWTAEGDQPRTEVRLAFLMLNCAEAALPMGGRVTLAPAGAGWTLAAQSPKLALDPALWDALQSPAVPLPVGPAQVQFALLRAEAAQRGRGILVDHGEGSLTLTV